MKFITKIQESKFTDKNNVKYCYSNYLTRIPQKEIQNNLKVIFLTVLEGIK